MVKIFKTLSDFCVKHLQCLPDFQKELNLSGKSSIFEIIEVGENKKNKNKIQNIVKNST